jgi:hypothetical protein
MGIEKYGGKIDFYLASSYYPYNKVHNIIIDLFILMIFFN